MNTSKPVSLAEIFDGLKTVIDCDVPLQNGASGHVSLDPGAKVEVSTIVPEAQGPVSAVFTVSSCIYEPIGALTQEDLKKAYVSPAVRAAYANEGQSNNMMVRVATLDKGSLQPAYPSPGRVVKEPVTLDGGAKGTRFSFVPTHH